jgi:hypothetical protein
MNSRKARRFLAGANDTDEEGASDSQPAAHFSVSLSYTMPKHRSSSAIVMPSPKCPSGSLGPRQMLQQLDRGTAAAAGSSSEPVTQALAQTHAAASAQHNQRLEGAEDDLLPDLLEKLRRRVNLNIAPPSTPSTGAVSTRSNGGPGQKQPIVANQTAGPVAPVSSSFPSYSQIPANTIRRVPPELIVVMLGYCSIQSICYFSQCSRRCQAMASSPLLWRAIGRGLRIEAIDLADGPTSKRMVRDYVSSVRRELTHHLHVEETRLQQVENRIRERIDAAPPFTAQFVEESTVAQPRLAALLERTQTNVANLDAEARQVQALRLDLVHSIQANRDQIQKLQRCLDNMERTHGARSAAEENYWLLSRFEARICRLLLGGLPQLPLVIRRGTTTFSMMELLTLQLARDELGAVIRTRWEAFKKVCPMNEAYFSLLDGVMSYRLVEVPREYAAVHGLVKKLAAMGDAQLMTLIGLR